MVILFCSLLVLVAVFYGISELIKNIKSYFKRQEENLNRLIKLLEERN
ncbi:hypothetical protein V7056_16540 [Bacillus sp. JJ664]